jgi:DNA-binding LacI/PurR family transcriptional regulator
MSAAVTRKTRRADLPTAGGQVESDIREKIRHADWFPGMMLPSQKTLARDYNVAPGTIQRVVKGLVAEGVLRADSRRGTFVADAPGGGSVLPRRRVSAPPKVAVVFEFNGALALNPAPFAIYQGIHEVINAQTVDYNLLTFNPMRENWEHLVALEKRALETIENDGFAAAVLWHSGSPETVPLVRRLQEKGVPLIFIDRHPPGVTCDFIGVDNYDGARSAVEHLVQLGHRRIAHLTTTEELDTVEARERGYRDALAAAGLAFDPALVVKFPYPEMTARIGGWVERARAMDNPPTAVFALQDTPAHCFIERAEAVGWRVPEDVSVIGFDDTEQYSPRPPILTSVRQPLEQMGRRAAELVLQRLADPRGGGPYQHVILPTRLITRSTCRPAP